MQTPDEHGRVELVKFQSPPHVGDEHHAPANTLGLQHITFAVDDIDDVVARLKAKGAELVGDLVRYEDSYRLCSFAARPGSSSSWRRRSPSR